MKLSVPYYSQFDEIKIPEWKERGCAVACLKMCLDFARPNEIPPIDDLIKEGEVINGYEPNVGWKHEALVRLAHNHGVLAYPEEFRSIKVDIDSKSFSESSFEKNLLDRGIERIKNSIDNNIPAIVSIQTNLGFHQVVVVGYEDRLGDIIGFFVNDPDNRSTEKKDLFVSLADFLKQWRKFAIFVG
jgi:hypothetical protein